MSPPLSLPDPIDDLINVFEKKSLDETPLMPDSWERLLSPIRENLDKCDAFMVGNIILYQLDLIPRDILELLVPLVNGCDKATYIRKYKLLETSENAVYIGNTFGGTEEMPIIDLFNE